MSTNFNAGERLHNSSNITNPAASHQDAQSRKIVYDGETTLNYKIGNKSLFVTIIDKNDNKKGTIKIALTGELKNLDLDSDELQFYVLRAYKTHQKTPTPKFTYIKNLDNSLTGQVKVITRKDSFIGTILRKLGFKSGYQSNFLESARLDPKDWAILAKQGNKEALSVLKLLVNDENSSGKSNATFELGAIYLKSENLDDKRIGEKYLQWAKEKGNTEAQYTLGQFYSKSDDTNQKREGIKYLNMAAKNGHQEAKIELGNLIANGTLELILNAPVLNATETPNQIEYLKLAADNGNPQAQYLMATLTPDSTPENREEKLNYLKSAADNQHPEALKELGALIVNNPEIKVNPKTLIQSLAVREQIEHTEIHSILMQKTDAPSLNLDEIYLLAMVELKDESTKPLGIFHLEEAAFKGHPDANYQLGLIRLEDQNTFDAGKAYLKIAADKGHQEAKNDLDIIANKEKNEAQYQLGIKYYRSDDSGEKARGLDFLHAAASNGHREAQYETALLILIKLKSEKLESDPKATAIAINYLQLAANGGHHGAQYLLANILLNKDERSPQETEKMMQYLKNAAEDGHVDAQYKYGFMMMDEEPAKAIQYFRMAAKQGHPEAQFDLGKYYFAKKNYQRAIEYLKKAVESEKIPDAKDYLDAAKAQNPKKPRVRFSDDTKP